MNWVIEIWTMPSSLGFRILYNKHQLFLILENIPENITKAVLLLLQMFSGDLKSFHVRKHLVS